MEILSTKPSIFLPQTNSLMEDSILWIKVPRIMQHNFLVSRSVYIEIGVADTIAVPYIHCRNFFDFRFAWLHSRAWSTRKGKKRNDRLCPEILQGVILERVG